MIGAGSVGNIAVFVGGGVYKNPLRSTTADAYTDNLVKIPTGSLPTEHRDLDGTSVGDYILYTGEGNQVYSYKAVY
jgi:hypothetical protein